MDQPAKQPITIDASTTVADLPAGKEIAISVRNLTISFFSDEGRVHAVRGVSFDLYRGETLCIVGESGSGKSVSSKAIMGILPGNARIELGSITYEGEDLTKISEEEFHRIRGTKIGMIFQDPLSSLNPIMKVGKQITEVMIINGNHLKHRFDDLIDDELIKYKNDLRLIQLARDNVKFIKKDASHFLKKTSLAEKTKIKEEHASFIAAEKLKRKNAASKDEASKEYRQACVEEKARVKANWVSYASFLESEKQKKALAIAKAKSEYLQKQDKLIPIIKEEKKALAIVKKNAHASVKAYKQSLVAEHHRLEKPIIKRLRSFNDIKDDYGDFISERRRFVSCLRVTRKEAKERALRIMQEVGIPEPGRRFEQYPFEFSGGMRQRIVIAIALTADPDVLICDEPTTALDVTIQAQILELINKIKAARHMSVIFITHDLGVVANMADRVAVMYAGKIVEYGNANEIFYHPAHPYTWALLSSIPDIDSKERLEAIPGTPPNPLFPLKGDSFALRSKYAMKIDFKEEPPMFKLSDTHYAATWLLDSRSPQAIMPKIVSTRIANSLRKAGVKDAK